jgi:hypothetical protein
MKMVAQIRRRNLIPSAYRNATLSWTDPFGKENVPTRFVAVDYEDDFSGGGGVFDCIVQAKEIRTHVRDREGKAIKQKAHLNLR